MQPSCKLLFRWIFIQLPYMPPCRAVCSQSPCKPLFRGIYKQSLGACQKPPCKSLFKGGLHATFWGLIIIPPYKPLFPDFHATVMKVPYQRGAIPRQKHFKTWFPSHTPNQHGCVSWKQNLPVQIRTFYAIPSKTLFWNSSLTSPTHPLLGGRLEDEFSIMIRNFQDIPIKNIWNWLPPHFIGLLFANMAFLCRSDHFI